MLSCDASQAGLLGSCYKQRRFQEMRESSIIIQLRSAGFFGLTAPKHTCIDVLEHTWTDVLIVGRLL
jgi:hypothetical protein